jgi:hypothetical protein
VHLLIVDAETRMVIAAACAVPGTIADAQGCRAPGRAAHWRGDRAGDGAYHTDSRPVAFTETFRL